MAASTWTERAAQRGAWVPSEYLAALEHRAAISARHETARARVAELRGQVNAAAADLGCDLESLAGVAGALHAWQQIAAAVPVVPDVDETVADQVVAELIATLPDLAPGRPPVYAAELQHHVIEHSRELPPVPVGNDHDTLEIFERVAAAGVAVEATRRALAAPLNGAPLGQRVHAICDFADGAHAEQAQLVQMLQRLVAETDTARLASPRVHRCALFSGATVTVDPVPAGVAWTLEWALAGNGRPPVAAGATLQPVSMAV